MDLTLNFPKSIFVRQFSFGMDFGTSTVKIVHTVENGENLQFIFTRFSKAELDNAFDFIAEICKGKLEPGSEVQLTGVGASAHMERLSKLLNVKISMHSEFVFDSNLTMLLAHHPWDSVFYPPSQEAIESGSRLARDWTGMMSMLLDDTMVPWPYMNDMDANDELVRNHKMPDNIKYPYIISFIGSAYGNFLVEDGKFMWLDHLGAPAGRTFLGLTSLFTGLKDFGEMVELASRGDASKVDELTSSLDGDVKCSQYCGVLNANLKLNPFGHCHGKSIGDFRQEDLAAAAMSLVAKAVAEQTYMWAAHHKVEQVFFAGGFSVCHPFIRQQVEKAFALCRFSNSIGHLCDCRFIRHGAYFGALAAIWKNLGIAEKHE